MTEILKSILVSSAELTDFVHRRIAYVRNRVVVLLLKEVHLKGEYGEKAVNRGTDVLDAVHLPCLNFGRDVVIDGANVLRLNEFRNLEVEARIVHQNDAIGAPCGNLLLTARHAFENGAQVEQDGDETHIGKVLVVA